MRTAGPWRMNRSAMIARTLAPDSACSQQGHTHSLRFGVDRRDAELATGMGAQSRNTQLR